MTSIGKGRGWARASDHETVLRRPGQSVSPKTSEIQELVNKINHLSFDAPSCKDFDKIITFLKNQSDDERTSNLDKLWKSVLEDRHFGVKYSELCLSEVDKNSTMEQLLPQIRRSLFTNAQSAYNRREKLYEEKPKHVTNLTWVLGLIMFHTKLPKMRLVLGEALRNCLSLLLETPSEDDIETVAIQLYLNGKFMKENNNQTPLLGKEHDDAELVDIVNKARRVLVDRNVSARSRALLLLIIEFAHQQYEPLTGELQAFYAAALEPTYLTEDSSTRVYGREFNQQLYLYQLLSKGMAKSESIAFQQVPSNKIQSQQQQHQKQQQQQQQVPQNMHLNEGNPGPVPRAIRGAGASESSKDYRNEKKSSRNHKDKLTDKQVRSAKPNTNSKVWGHDDRFDNDYE